MINLNHIEKEEALRYLGYGINKPDEKTQDIINDCESELILVIKPRYLYKVFDINISENGYILNNCKLMLNGNDIKNHLNDCEKAVLMCATLSAEVDKLIRTTQISDMTRTIILDSLASAAIEQVCDKVEELIKSEFADYFQTWRYSPGYGDFPIEIQKDFLDVLDAPKKIGLMATQSSILTPRKSVTAIIGLSKNQIPKRTRGCQSCNLKETCAIRKEGEHCGFKTTIN